MAETPEHLLWFFLRGGNAQQAGQCQDVPSYTSQSSTSGGRVDVGHGWRERWIDLCCRRDHASCSCSQHRVVVQKIERCKKIQ